MKAQIQNTTEGITLSHAIADLQRVVSSMKDKKSHKPQVTKNYPTSKFITVERYQKEYEVEFAYVLDELEIWSVNGIVDVEDTFNERFLDVIKDKIEERLASSNDNDEEYDNHFQNQ